MNGQRRQTSRVTHVCCRTNATTFVVVSHALHCDTTHTSSTCLRTVSLFIRALRLLVLVHDTVMQWFYTVKIGFTGFKVCSWPRLLLTSTQSVLTVREVNLKACMLNIILTSVIIGHSPGISTHAANSSGTVHTVEVTAKPLWPAAASSVQYWQKFQTQRC